MKLNHSIPVSRRKFLENASRAGLACGFACMCPTGLAAAGNAGIPDPKALNYCGYTCPRDCPMKLAGKSGDIEKKKAAFEMWRIQDRYGLEFDADTVFCNGCKTDQSLGVAVANCPVRKCAVEKGFNCCIECDSLSTCDKALWKEFPEFHTKVVGMQRQYRAS